VGSQEAQSIQAIVRAAMKPTTGFLATLLSILTLALGASSVVVELRDALNTIWHVPMDQGRTGFAGFVVLLKERFFSFVVVLGVGFLLLASLILSAWIAAMGKFFGSVLSFGEPVLHVVTFLVSFFVITFLFAAIYKILPEVDLHWSDVLVGASVTSITFTLGKQLIGLYLGKAAFGSTYGADGSLVMVLVWVYYSAQLFFFGAEFTKVYTRKFGSHFVRKLEIVAPKPGAAILKP